MGLRRMIPRMYKSKKFWLVALVALYFYVNVTQLAKMAMESEQERLLGSENHRRKSTGLKEEEQDENNKEPEEEEEEEEEESGLEDNIADNDEEEEEDDEDEDADDADDDAEEDEEANEEDYKNEEQKEAKENVEMNNVVHVMQKEINRDERGNEFVNKNENEVNVERELNVNSKDLQENGGVGKGKEDSFYNGYYKLHETQDNAPISKVLLLTYQRAGSTFAGELLTSGGDSMYVFEPLYLWRNQLGPGADPNLERNAALVLGDILDCKPEVIATWKRKGFNYFRRKLEVDDFCESAKLRLLKTIRARAHFIMPWIKGRPDIKIVHLVRDPRGILNSVQRGGRWWSENNRNTQLQCSLVARDLDLQSLGTDRYLRVRYEDLVDKTLEETKRIFEFMGVPYNKDVWEYIQVHTGNSKITGRKPGYFNTFRNPDFRHDHWKEKLDNREIEFVEQICSSIMTALGYETN